MNVLPSSLLLLLLSAAPADGWLGIYLDADSDAPRVLEVIPASPAAKAGLQAGDLILAMDDRATTTRDAFVAAVRACKVGQRVRLKVERDGRELQIAVELGARADDAGVPPSEAPAPERPGAPPAAPVEVAPPAPTPAHEPPAHGPGRSGPAYLGVQFGMDDGRLTIAGVVDGSPAAKAGLQAGDVILAIGEQPTTTVEAFVAAVHARKVGQRVRLTVERGGRELQVTAKLGERADGGAPPPSAAPARPSGPAYLGVRVSMRDGDLAIAQVVDGSPAQRAGLAVGDVLLRWNGTPIATLDRLGELVASGRPGQDVDLEVRRNGAEHTLQARLGSAPGTLAPPEPDAPAPSASGESGDAVDPLDLPFGTDYEAAVADASARGMPMLVVYGAAWDGASQAQRRALAAPALRDVLASYVCVYVEADGNRDLFAQQKVQALPVLEVYRGDRIEWRHDGFLPADVLSARLGKGVPSRELAPRTGRRHEAVPDRPPLPGEAAEPAKAGQPARPVNAPQAGGGAEAPARTGEPDDDAARAELQRLREELEDLRRLLDELRKARSGGE